MTEPSKQLVPSRWTSGLSDADFRNTMLASLRLLAVLTVLIVAMFWWKSGWRSAVLVVVGAAISRRRCGSGCG